MCASGSHVWNGQSGSFTANPMNSSANMTPAGRRRFAPWLSASRIAVMSNVPVEKNSARIPISMNALPEYGEDEELHRRILALALRLAAPYGDMRKNIGISSSSQNRKKSRKSIAVNTPMTAALKREQPEEILADALASRPTTPNTATMPKQPGEQ